MKKKKVIVFAVLVAVIVIAAIAFSGCIEKKQEEIKVGAILPLTGDVGAYGINYQKGIDLAVEEINDNGGIDGVNISVLYKDNEGKSDKTVSAMNELAGEVPVVIGAAISANTVAICPIAEEKKVVLISPGSTSPKLSDYRNYVFRTVPSDEYQGKALADVVLELKGGRAKVAVVYIDNVYGNGLKEAFVKTYQEQGKGGNIVAVESYEEGNTDFKQILTDLKEKKPDAVVLITYVKGDVAILKQAKKMGLNENWVGSDGAKSDAVITLAGEDAEGLRATYPISMVSEPVTDKFVNLYRGKYGAEHIDTDVAYGYDTMHVVAEAIEKGGYDAEDISDALREIRHHGVCGVKKFDENGDVPPAYDLWKVKNLEWVLESKLVI
jgi:branched-chain amino acid transport system substrate-binding protein